MKLYKGLAAFLVKDSTVVKELQAVAEKEGLSLVRLNDRLLVAPPEDGKALRAILEKRGYYPLPMSNYRKNGN